MSFTLPLILTSDQLMFVPSNIGPNQTSQDPEKVRLKTILVWSGLGGWGGVRGGREHEPPLIDSVSDSGYFF